MITGITRSVKRHVQTNQSWQGRRLPLIE